MNTTTCSRVEISPNVSRSACASPTVPGRQARREDLDEGPAQPGGDRPREGRLAGAGGPEEQQAVRWLHAVVARSLGVGERGDDPVLDEHLLLAHPGELAPQVTRQDPATELGELAGLSRPEALLLLVVRDRGLPLIPRGREALGDELLVRQDVGDLAGVLLHEQPFEVLEDGAGDALPATGRVDGDAHDPCPLAVGGRQGGPDEPPVAHGHDGRLVVGERGHALGQAEHRQLLVLGLVPQMDDGLQVVVVELAGHDPGGRHRAHLVAGGSPGGGPPAESGDAGRRLRKRRRGQGVARTLPGGTGARAVCAAARSRVPSAHRRQAVRLRRASHGSGVRPEREQQPAEHGGGRGHQRLRLGQLTGEPARDLGVEPGVAGAQDPPPRTTGTTCSARPSRSSAALAMTATSSACRRRSPCATASPPRRQPARRAPGQRAGEVDAAVVQRPRYTSATLPRPTAAARRRGAACSARARRRPGRGPDRRLRQPGAAAPVAGDPAEREERARSPSADGRRVDAGAADDDRGVGASVPARSSAKRSLSTTQARAPRAVRRGAPVSSATSSGRSRP